MEEPRLQMGRLFSDRPDDHLGHLRLDFLTLQVSDLSLKFTKNHLQSIFRLTKLE